MRRNEGKIRSTLRLVGQHVTRLKDQDPDEEQTSPTSIEGMEGSPLENTGPFPAELLKDPDSIQSVPWSIRRAEARRERLVWMTVLIVSWLVSAVALLRWMSIL
jgi:hypothetical protein